MHAFNSLDDLNKFLTSKGLPLLTEETIAEAINNQIGEGATEGIVKISLVGGDDDENASSLAQALAAAFGGGTKDAEGIPEAPEPTGTTDSDKLLSDYMDLTNEVIANLLIQKRALADELENEIKAHMQCHEHMEEALHKMRLQGWAEGIAAGLVPGVPWEKIGPGIQEAIMRQAEQGMTQMDSIRVG